MEKIILRNFGRIKKLDLEIKNLTILTGEQTSGKSTVAQSIFFFKYIPNQILEFLVNYKKNQKPKIIVITNYIISHFKKLWSEHYYSEKTIFEYYYSEEIKAEIIFDKDKTINLKFSDKIITDIQYFIETIDFDNYSAQIKLNAKELGGVFIKEINNIFPSEHDDLFYIPAGRSTILKVDKQKLLEEEIGYTINKQNNFIESLQSIVHFNDFFLNKFATATNSNVDFLKGNNKNKQVDEIIEKLLKGELVFEDNTMFLAINNKKFQLSELSSGQEEILWLATFLKQFMNENISRYLIIEEPETNLYPTAQRDIVMLIALFLNSKRKNKHKILVTTHSAYVLSVFNNLFLAQAKFKEDKTKNKNKIHEIIPKEYWLDIKETTALLFKPDENEIENCINTEYNYIELDSVDAVAEEINKLFYEILEID